MFKFMKQGVSLAAAVAAAGSCIPVYAAGIQPRTSIQAPDGSGNTETGNGEESGGTSITIAEPVEGHRYKVYQVFKGRVSSDGTKLSNVEYGANYSGREGVTLADDLAQLEAEGAEAKAFAETVRDLLRGEPAAVLSVENPTAELEAGYYMILDETLYEVDGDSLSDYIVTVAGNVTVQPKSTGVPEFDKSIDDGKSENGGDEGGAPEGGDGTQNPGIPPFEVPEDADISSETADIDWNYTLHEDTGVITLNYYIGTKTDVKVYSHYRVSGDDRVWKAEFPSNNINSNGDSTSNYVFAGKNKIINIVFSDEFELGSCVKMNRMFYGCSSLESVYFGKMFNTSKIRWMRGLFEGCSSLINVNIDVLNTSNVENMDYMFKGCKNLEPDVSQFDTSNVTTMREMFQATKGPKGGKLDFNTSKVEDMVGMFSSSTALNIDVSSLDTSNVKYMSSMFGYCKNIESIDLRGLDTSKVEWMGNMFNGCSSLKTVNMSNINTSMVNDMNRMFCNCPVLAEVNVSGIDTSNVEDMQSMFASTGLTFLDLTSFDTSKATEMNAMFGGSRGLKNIYVTKGKWVTEQAGNANLFLLCGTDHVTYINPDDSAVSAILPLSYAAENTEGLQPGEAEPEKYIEVEGDDTSVEYGIGDSIPYKLTATMPESITAYNKYVLAFHDKLSAGLDYDRDSLKVFAGDTEIPAEHYTVTYSEDGKSMTVSIADVKAAPWNAVPGTQIIVKYSAVLNENAQTGNTNEAFLEYSNDPKGDGTGTTGPGVPDIVTVYTFELRFDKVDKNGNALEGAGFTLYKKNDAGEFVPAGDEIKGMTRFSFKGLAAGEYKLVETTTPDGYNTMEDLYFNIVAEEAESGGETVKRISIEAPDGSPLSGWTAISADKAFESDIANYTGSTLPETGGAGTYLLYAAGVAVVITAGAVIAARKKADEE